MGRFSPLIVMRGGSPLALAHRADDIWSYEGYKVPSSSYEGARHSLSHTGPVRFFCCFLRSSSPRSKMNLRVRVYLSHLSESLI
jgi:hypothetical protein